MSTFIVIKLSTKLSLKVMPGGTILWVDDAREANSYPSKYAAKKHLKQLDIDVEDVSVIELVTEKEDV